MTLKKRLMNGVIAGGFGLLVNTGVQIVTLPLFLWAWGSERYGEWLLISAVPAYLALSDVGFSSVATNQMAMDVAAGKRVDALRVFQSTFAIVLAAMAITLALAAVSGVLPVESLLHLRTLSHAEATELLILLAGQVALGFLTGMLSAGYRCEGGYARITHATNALRLAEFAVTAVMLMLHFQMRGVAAAVLVTRFLGCGLMRHDLKRIAPWLQFRLTQASVAQIRQLLRPAVAFAAWPLAAAIQQQGFVLMVGSLLGAPAVVTWSACRTLSRALFQASGILKNALWPEFSHALGSNNRDLLRRLHRTGYGVLVWINLLIAVPLFAAHDVLFRVWSHGVIQVGSVLFGLTLVQIVASLLWDTSAILAAAVNRHQRNTLSFVVLAALGLAISVPMTRAFGLAGATACLLGTDVVMFPIALSTAFGIVGDRAFPFWRSITEFPWHFLSGGIRGAGRVR